MPEETSIVRTNNQVVTTRMDIKGGDPTRTGLDNLDQFLLLKIVAADCALCCNEKERSRRVKLDGLCNTRKAAERNLCKMLREGVYRNGASLSRG